MHVKYSELRFLQMSHGLMYVFQDLKSFENLAQVFALGVGGWGGVGNTWN